MSDADADVDFDVKLPKDWEGVGGLVPPTLLILTLILPLILVLILILPLILVLILILPLRLTHQTGVQGAPLGLFPLFLAMLPLFLPVNDYPESCQ